MSDVIKRNRTESSADLVSALVDFIELLKTEGEDDAVKVLQASAEILKDAQQGSDAQKGAVTTIIDSFDGELELNVYTLHKSTDEWTKADQLSNASTRVLSLAKRIINSL